MDKNKEATPENLNALKEALKKVPNSLGVVKVVPDKKEVPEETLRKILKGE